VTVVNRRKNERREEIQGGAPRGKGGGVAYRLPSPDRGKKGFGRKRRRCGGNRKAGDRREGKKGGGIWGGKMTREGGRNE